MSVYVSFTNPPKPSPNAVLDITATVRNVAKQFPGFPGYIFANPDQWNAEGEMGYPGDLNGPQWKSGCDTVKPGVLWPRIGGCKTVYDVPQTDGPIATLMDRFRPSKTILCDYGSGGDARAVSDRYQRIITDNLQVFAPEANARREWIVPAANVWLVAEWFHLNDVPITGAANDCDADRWSVREWLAADPDTKFIVEVTSDTRKNLGFAPTANNPNPCPDWPAAKVDIAKRFHGIDPNRVIVSVRMSGMNAAQVNELRGLNK